MAVDVNDRTAKNRKNRMIDFGQEELQADRLGFLAGRRRLRFLRHGVVVQAVPLGRQRRHHEQTEQSGRDQGRAPSEGRGEKDHRRRRCRRAEMTREGVHAEGAAHARGRDRRGEDGVIGRMEDAVADCRHRDETEHDREGGREADQPEAEGDDDQPRRQHQPGAEAIDQEADRHLADGGGGADHGHHDAELGIADVEGVFQKRKQRRQRQPVEMAHEMAGADQA